MQLLKILNKILRPVILVLTCTLSGCYLPTNYLMETTIDQNGNYFMRFRGYVVSLPYYKKLHNKEFKTNEEHIEFHKRELKELYNKDPYMKRITYAKDGYFWIDWSVKDNILKHHYIATISRNNRFATLAYYMNKRITKFTTNSLSYKQILKLKKVGINIKGHIIIKTNAKILQNNAMKITKNPNNWVTYEWYDKTGKEPTPIIVFNIKLKK